jgi:hypothetical protein
LKSKTGTAVITATGRKQVIYQLLEHRNARSNATSNTAPGGKLAVPGIFLINCLGWEMTSADIDAAIAALRGDRAA